MLEPLLNDWILQRFEFHPVVTGHAQPEVSALNTWQPSSASLFGFIHDAGEYTEHFLYMIFWNVNVSILQVINVIDVKR